ncbi:nucleoside deaminase [Bacteroidota bacterium]
MKEKVNKYMQMAIDLAKENAVSAGGGPFGAVIVMNDEVVSASSNSVTPDNDPTAHAEVNAIRAACRKLNTFNLSGCTLYTSCEPCPMCLSAAYWARIDKIYFSAGREDAHDAGFSDAFLYKELSLPLEERTIPIERSLESEGLEPFKLWVNNNSKVPY